MTLASGKLFGVLDYSVTFTAGTLSGSLSGSGAKGPVSGGLSLSGSLSSDAITAEAKKLIPNVLVDEILDAANAALKAVA